MSDTQSKIIKLIQKMNNNGLRIGQIMSNLFDQMAGADGTDPFYMEDEKLLKHLEEYSK